MKTPLHTPEIELTCSHVTLGLVSEKEEFHFMKKQLIALTAIAALSVGAAGSVSAASVHTVEKGDTLWSISQEQNVSVQDLQDWNKLDSTVIYPNQQLKVEEALKTYKVVLGDTLSEIAQKHHMTVQDLKSRNNLTGDLIVVGDQLVIEGEAVAKPAVKGASVTKEPVKEVTKTKAPVKEATKAQAKPVAATKELTVESTAYTADCSGCSGITATGINLKANPNQKVISVDPSVIPLGSKVWVEGYGEAIAGDTGGAIKGNKIDIYMQSHEAAINWGRKNIKVKILD